MLLGLALFALWSSPAAAQIALAKPPKTGYVVRVEKDAAWLDFTAADGAEVGRAFTIFSEGAELKHPVTGASLGRVESKLGEGTIKEVSEKYSLGSLSSKTGDIAPGARARLGAPPAAAAPAPTAPAPARPGETQIRAPRSRGEPLPFSVAAMAVGDFDGIRKPQVVLADSRSFRLYSYPAAENKPLVEGEISGTGARIVSLESGDLDADEKAELFVTVYNEPFRRLETIVFKVESGKWIKAADLPFLVRSHQNPKGERVLAAQQLQDDKSFPFGAIFPLVYNEGRYEQGRPALRPKRVDWIYGFTYAQLDKDEPALLSLTSVDSLRVSFPKGHWRSSESYGQSPVRVNWNDRMLEFHPPMAVAYGANGFDSLYIARNLALLGGLATPFGLFSGGEIHAKKWTGVALETAWKADLGGYCQGLALTEPEPGRKELVVAVTGSTGKSAVWTFDP